VVIVLDPHEEAVFDGMVTRLRAGDPTFARRVAELDHPAHGPRLALAVLLWTTAPICIVLGGWTGLFIAVAAVGYGVMLTTRQTGTPGHAVGSRWSPSSGRRPGASL
jgi:Protein of unknown function (DUF3040)